jgi:Domain of unknown function (DUF4189)
MTPAARAAAVALIGCVVAAGATGARVVKKQQLWGAVAYNSKTGAYGYAVDVKSKRDAEAGAFRQCGNDCDTIRTFRNTCGAIAVKPRHTYWDTGASREIVETKVLKKCGDAQCKVVVWACTTEK